MQENGFVNDNLITLDGVWSTERAVEIQGFLNGRLAVLAETEPGLDRTQIDLSGLSDLDACGCQLLVVFMENLRRRGISPIPSGLDRQTTDKITLLGFSGAFTCQQSLDPV